MLKTPLKNHVYYIVCLIVAVYAALPVRALSIIPPWLKPYIIGAVIVAGWIKSHRNLFKRWYIDTAPPIRDLVFTRDPTEMDCGHDTD